MGKSVFMVGLSLLKLTVKVNHTTHVSVYRVCDTVLAAPHTQIPKTYFFEFSLTYISYT